MSGAISANIYKQSLKNQSVISQSWNIICLQYALVVRNLINALKLQSGYSLCETANDKLASFEAYTSSGINLTNNLCSIQPNNIIPQHKLQHCVTSTLKPSANFLFAKQKDLAKLILCWDLQAFDLIVTEMFCPYEVHQILNV